jgi:signal transduction histidine kinase
MRRQTENGAQGERPAPAETFEAAGPATAVPARRTSKAGRPALGFAPRRTPLAISNVNQPISLRNSIAEPPGPSCRQLFHAQEHEKQCLAREMHDSLGQYLVRIRHLALLGTQRPGPSTAAARQCAEISSLAATAIQEMRRIIQGLRPEELDCLGFSEAVRAMVEAAAASTTTRFNIDVDQVDDLLTSSADINLFRVIQEGVNNIINHSRASLASIVIKRRPRSLWLVIRDDGVGLDPRRFSGRRQTQDGFGLSSMRERIQILGGELQMSSGPETGTTLQAEIPLPV